MDEHKLHKSVFLIVLRVNLVVFVFELLIALSSGSLTMLSDSFHLFIHIIASLLAFVSELDISGFSPDKIKRFTALTNIVLFFITGGFIFKEAWERLSAPPDVNISLAYFVIAVVGLIANIYTVRLLHRIRHHDCSSNIEPLYWCMVVDIISSVIVILAGGAVYYSGLSVVDPISSFAIVALIAYRGWKMWRETV